MPRWSDCISGIAWFHLGVEPVELSEIAVDRDMFHVLLRMLPRDPPNNSGSQTFSDREPFVGPVLSRRTTLFQENSMYQI